MFTGFMVNTWIAATIVAVVAGVVGFFVVMRGSSFVAHAIPNSAFAGAAAASLIGVSTIGGMLVAAVVGALGIGVLSKRGRHDVATALAIVVMLGLGALFLSFSTEYYSAIYSLLFGEVLGISSSELVPTVVLGVLAIMGVAVWYRPLILTSVMPDVAAARGANRLRIELVFLMIVAVTTTMSVPVVGALLMFSLMIGPPAAARSFTSNPLVATVFSVAFALASVWTAIAVSYVTNWPIGFFVGVVGAALYITGRCWALWRRSRVDKGVPIPEKLPVAA